MYKPVDPRSCRDSGLYRSISTIFTLAAMLGRSARPLSVYWCTYRSPLATTAIGNPKIAMTTREIICSMSALIVSVIFLNLGIGAINSFVTLRMNVEGFASIYVGISSSAYYIGLVSGTLLCGKLINRIGHIRAFGVFAACIAIAINLFPLYIDPTVWIGLRLICGMNLAGLLIVAESWLNNRASNETRGSVFSIYMMASFMSAGLGQSMLIANDIRSDSLFSICAIIFCLALIPVAVTRATNPEQIGTKSMTFHELYTISPSAVISGLCSGVISGALYGTGTMYAVGQGFDVTSTALFMTALVMGGLLLQYPIGRLSDRFDRRLVIIGSSIALTVVSLFIIWLSSGSWWSFMFFINSDTRWPFLLTTLLIGGITATLYPLSVAYANDYLEPHQLVPASGGLVLTFGLGAITGPTLSAASMTVFGPPGLFGFIAFAAALASAFIVYRITRRSWAPVIEKETYVPMPDPISMPVATEIDPRALASFGPEDIGPPACKPTDNVNPTLDQQ